MSIGHSVLEYNGIRIVDCQTLKFDQRAVHDGLTHTADNYTIRVQGYFLSQTTAQTGIEPKDGSGSETAGAQYVKLRKALSEPRKPLRFTLGKSQGSGTEAHVLVAYPVSSDGNNNPNDLDYHTDSAGGPRPTHLDIKHIAGNAALRVEFEVTCQLPSICGIEYSNNQTPGGPIDTQLQKGVLSNKWSCADSIDENFFTTRTWVGELKLANPLRNPHDFRGLCVPALQPSMKRTSMRFTASQDGLSLRYEITDREVWITSPLPGTTIKIQHKHSVGRFAHKVHSSLTVTVKGDRFAEKQRLIRLAMAVADGKLRLRQLVPENGIDRERPAIVQRYDLLEDSGTSADNMVQVAVQLEQLPPANQVEGRQDLFRRVMKGFGRKLDSSDILNYMNTRSQGNYPGEHPAASGPVALIGAFSAHLQDCYVNHGMNEGVPSDARTAGIIRGTAGDFPELPEIDADVVDDLADLPDETFSSSHKSGLYSHYEVETELVESPLVVQLPVAKPYSENDRFYREEGYSFGGNDPNPPVTGGDGPALPDKSASFIKLGPNQMRRVVKIVAERIGAVPGLLRPRAEFVDKDGVQHVLLSQQDNFGNPERTPDGEARTYTVRATYVYGVDRPLQSVLLASPDYESLDQDQSPWIFTPDQIFNSGHITG